MYNPVVYNTHMYIYIYIYISYDFDWYTLECSDGVY